MQFWEKRERKHTHKQAHKQNIVQSTLRLWMRCNSAFSFCQRKQWNCGNFFLVGLPNDEIMLWNYPWIRRCKTEKSDTYSLERDSTGRLDFSVSVPHFVQCNFRNLSEEHQNVQDDVECWWGHDFFVAEMILMFIQPETLRNKWENNFQIDSYRMNVKLNVLRSSFSFVVFFF